jgi:phosphoribosylanthranilate isomerase
MPTEVKICGLSDEEGVDAALAAGADLVGFVFYRPSPRYVAIGRAAALAERARGRAKIVALTVDADDTLLSEIAASLRPDLMQLHGQETAERVAAIRQLIGLPVMKAVGIAGAGELAEVAVYAKADRILLDAKPPRDASRPGGHGRTFDWSILGGFAPGKPWLLAGGLTPANVADALAATRPTGVDVSSGVESAPGCKDANLIRAFITAVRAVDAPQRLAI